MSKQRRDTDGQEPTNQLVGIFVTPTEKKLIEKALPEGQSISSYCRNLILPVVTRTVIRQTEINKKRVINDSLS